MTARIIATLLASLAFSGPVLAFGAIQNEQVIPPAVYENQEDSTMSDPISMQDVVITHLTPADEFANAITPLVVTLGLGSIGLVVYTLVNKGRQPGLPD